MSATSILRARKIVNSLSYVMKELAAKALELQTAEEVLESDSFNS